MKIYRIRGFINCSCTLIKKWGLEMLSFTPVYRNTGVGLSTPIGKHIPCQDGKGPVLATFYPLRSEGDNALVTWQCLCLVCALLLESVLGARLCRVQQRQGVNGLLTIKKQESRTQYWAKSRTLWEKSRTYYRLKSVYFTLIAGLSPCFRVGSILIKVGTIQLCGFYQAMSCCQEVNNVLKGRLEFADFLLSRDK